MKEDSEENFSMAFQWRHVSVVPVLFVLAVVVVNRSWGVGVLTASSQTRCDNKLKQRTHLLAQCLLLSLTQAIAKSRN